MTQLEGTYRGNVVSNIDPMQTGRLQVDVPAAGITGAWAEACVPPIPRSLVRLPAAGSTAWVCFEGGDSDYPIWTGVTWDALQRHGQRNARERGHRDDHRAVCHRRRAHGHRQRSAQFGHSRHRQRRRQQLHQRRRQHLVR